MEGHQHVAACRRTMVQRNQEITLTVVNDPNAPE
jgi:hypothetical protein